MNQTNLQQEEVFNNKKAFYPFMKRIFKHSFSYKKWTFSFVFCAVLVAAIDALFPLVWFHFIDKFITPIIEAQKNAAIVLPFDITKRFITYILVYVFLVILSILGLMIFEFFAGRVKEKVIFDLREQMFAKLQALPYSFYDRSSLGWLGIRLTADVDKVSEVISFGFVSLIVGFSMIIVSLAAMFYYNWTLAVVVLIALPIMLFLSIRIRRMILKYARKARRMYSIMAAFLTESINGVEVNKATVHEQKSANQFDYVTTDLKNASFRSSYFSAMYHPVIIMCGAFVAFAVVYWGGLQVVALSGFTVGLLAAFFGYARMIFEPIMEVTRFYAAAQDSLSAGERIYSLIDEDVAIKDSQTVIKPSHVEGKIAFESVDFSYVSDKPIIKNLNLTIKAGESVALVGPTGEGKSTLVNLIARFYEPTAGVIKIDDLDYKQLSLKDYRACLGIVLQQTHLFSGTIATNIRYGKLNASEQEIIEALKLLGADEFLPRLNEEVGEEGNLLSAGEKQLIAFARVVIRNPSVIIMDEATASLDTLSEKRLQDGVAAMLKGRTSLVIAHRLSTIKNCDRILYIKEGQVIEDGNHEELYLQKGAYYTLYKEQLVD